VFTPIAETYPSPNKGTWGVGMNKLFFGDNLDVLRREIDAESVDLVYLDPPFNSSAQYNVLFETPDAEKASAQAEAFVTPGHGARSQKELMMR
jgi:16S rRNA G966 N2-methylase RsmD